MAEVLAVVGSLGAIANIIDVASKAISVIHNLHVQWENADLTILSLASQLSAFRAALRRIQEWLDSEVPAAHHQLTMDLDETISFCNMLVMEIQVLSAGWELLLEDSKAIASRWKVTVGHKGLDNILVLVERQTIALTLLLTACNCKTMAEQKQLLEKPRTRRVLQRAKADSASLFVHKDSTSMKSRWTDNLSKVSRVFDFDPEVFSTGVYHRVFRGSLKYRLRQQQQHTTWMRSHRESLVLARACEASMLEDCDVFAAHYMKRLAELDAEHALTYFDDQAGQITRRISQAYIIWLDPAFQQLLVGGPSGPLMGGPSMTLCRFFAHQIKALGEDRFHHQIGDCLDTLALAYETATMHRAHVPKHIDDMRPTDYSVYTAWSRTSRQATSNTLTVVISVPLADNHYECCIQEEVQKDLSTSLQPLIYDVKYCSPIKFTFVLLLSGSENFIERLPAMCFPIARHTQSQYLNVVLAEIVRLFRQSNEETECDYLTIWNNQQINESILGTVERVSRKGQVTMDNGIFRAKLLPIK